ncbi:MAG: hypothetical protein AMK72_13725 [Planctomycetes bacterium SM23_25]|nr:MAG: hypothetical protein AMK72_13725 [Planctomycetes bacterium SM23_25]
MLAGAGVCLGAGLDSAGNTDGVLTWHLGTVEAGGSAREVVLFAFDASHEKVTSLLEAAREEFARLPDPPPAAAGAKPQPTAWIRNDSTDFALEGPGHFFWEGKRQSLASARGGQCSRFGWYVHYTGDGAARRAGTPITGNPAPENLEVLQPAAAVAPDQAVATVETADGRLRIRIRASLGQGNTAAVEFVLTNTGGAPLADVRLSAYANLEAAHDHENDYATLDARTGGVLTVDPPTGTCVVMAGLTKPAAGYSGTWASQRQLAGAVGTPAGQWKAFTAVPDTAKQSLAQAPRRPGIYEQYAPAPKVLPVLPETRTLTPEEEKTLLERDWILQAEGKPLADRALQEIGWARELAARLAKHPHAPDLSADLAELGDLQGRLVALGPKAGEAAARDLYLAVRRAKRRIVFANPVIDFTEVLFIDNPYPQGREWPHQARHRNGMMAVPGGRLLVLEGLAPGGRIRKLAPDWPGSFWKADLSFDAKRVLFCFWRNDEPSFHLYEVDIDGSGLRQLTRGPYDDLDPIYLPDGHIMFTTTRANTYVRCMPYTYSYVLARCDADGGNIYLVSQNNEPDWCPALLNDGRIIYSRWEYTDKALWRIQSLWTVNQDGTSVTTFWGNQSVWPDHLAEPQPIPGSQRVMFTGLAHHNWFAGSIGIIDPSKGFNFPHGLTKVTRDVPWPECGRPPVDPPEKENYHAAGRLTAYKSPWPLSEEDFLVSARCPSRGDKFVLYLMDTCGNRELLYEGVHNIWHAMPVRPRRRPPVHADRVAWPGTGNERTEPKPGVLFSTNVRQNVPALQGAKVRHLRVIEMEARTYSLWTRDGRFSGPAVSALQDDGVKRILGTVPVEADGSVHFKVPPGAALHFQLLDEQYRALQTMRSFVGVMPAEERGCVGCHELHTVTPLRTSTAAALRRGPSDLEPPPWGTDSISYGRMVQPVLDRYCGTCHQGDGKGRKKLDLTLRPGTGIFAEPYLTLVGPVGFGLNSKPHTPGIAGALMCENYAHSDPESYATSPPMRHLSYTSRLVEIAMSGKHNDVKVDPVSVRQLIAWVDANCPYRGDDDIRALPDPSFARVEELPIRPRIWTAPRIARP